MDNKNKIYAIVAIIAVVILGYFINKNLSGAKFKKESHEDMNHEMMTEAKVKTVTGTIKHQFEGDNKLTYTLTIPETATTTVNDRLVKVINGTSTIMSYYFSYEGGRGYTASDYINEIIMKKVANSTKSPDETIASSTWAVAESPFSQYRVTSVLDGQWLVMVESPKAYAIDVPEYLAKFEVTK